MSASVGNTLPPEVIEAILRLLPAKSLGRFKSVSKTWNSLISDPHFVKNHLHQTTKNIIVFDQKSPILYSINSIKPKKLSSAKKLSFGSTPVVWEKEILGSCNGLIVAKDVNEDMFLMNPTTQELFKLPPNPFEFPLSLSAAACYVYGFGYDSSTDNYKLVLIWFIPRFSSLHLRSLQPVPTHTVSSIYSLRNNSWRKLPNSPQGYPVFDGALVNRNCHWLTSSSITVFSFADEVFTEIKLPDSFEYKGVGFYDRVVEIGGRLGFFFLGIGDRPDSYELWVMHEYGDAKSWARVYSHRNLLRPLCVVERRDRDIVLIYKNEVVVLNIDDGRCRTVRIVGGPSQFSIRGTFVETIESPRRIVAAP